MWFSSKKKSPPRDSSSPPPRNSSLGRSILSPGSSSKVSLPAGTMATAPPPLLSSPPEPGTPAAFFQAKHAHFADCEEKETYEQGMVALLNCDKELGALELEDEKNNEMQMNFQSNLETAQDHLGKAVEVYASNAKTKNQLRLHRATAHQTMTECYSTRKKLKLRPAEREEAKETAANNYHDNLGGGGIASRNTPTPT
ncbi:MAG: hypothetical protein SGILL_006935 [Bacillariaceae sp.]